MTVETTQSALNRRIKSEDTLSPDETQDAKGNNLASLAAVQLLDSCFTLPVEYIPTEYVGPPPPCNGFTPSGEPIPIMISTLSMHVRYGRTSSTIDNNAWGAGNMMDTYPQIPDQWKSIWRSGYDGPWSSGSGSGTKHSLEKSGDHSLSLPGLDMEIINAATDKLRRIGRRARGRYRRALNVSEATQLDSALPPEAEYAGRRASELPRLDELEEDMADEDRPLIPWKTCPKSAPAILAQPRPRTELRPEEQHRLRMPGRSLSQSYLGLPEQYAKKEAVADRIKSLGRILRRSNSLSNSTPATLPDSGVPTPPSDSSSRRRLARNQDIHSDSFLGSPMYATASEGSSLSSSPDLSRGIFEPLVKSGTMVAAAELDRLSFAANAKETEANLSELGTTPATSQASSAQTHDVPPNSPASLPASISGATSPALLMSNGLAPMTPIVPNNTPASVSATPVVPLAGTHSFKYSVRRKAARASRLSEVHLADTDDIAEELGSDSESVVATGASTTTVDQTSTDGTPLSNDTEQSGYGAGDDEPSLQSRSLTGSPKLSRRHGRRLRHTLTVPADEKPVKQKVSLNDVDMTQLTELIDKAIVNAIAQQRLTTTRTSTYPARSGATTPCFDVTTLRSSVASQLKLAHHDSCESPSPPPSGLAIRPLINSRASSPGSPLDSGLLRPLTMISAAISSATPASSRLIAQRSTSASKSDTHVIPCKGDTWDPASGDEPRDSDPFCPADEDDSAHEELEDRRVDKLRRDRRRRNTSGTVYMLKESDSTDSGSDESKELAVENREP